MKKRILSITIFLLSFFVICGVKAAPEYDAAGVNTNYQRYQDAVNEMSSLNCSSTLYNQTIVDRCNELELQKTTSLSYIYNANEYDDDLVSGEAQNVIDSNSSQCSTLFSSEFQEAINKVFLLFYIAGPILLILFGSLDLTKAIVAGDEKKRKALYVSFVKRSIALALLFAAPVLVNLIVNAFSVRKLSGNKYTCSFTAKKLTISYVSRKRASGGKGSYGPSTGSIKMFIPGENDAEEGDYVVIDTTYPGGIQGFSEMVISNGIIQDEDGAWSDCCAGFAQAHSCGLQNGTTLTQSGLGLEYGDSSCNSISGGCSGIWEFNSSHCFATEEEYMEYVIDYIRQGVPVMTMVRVGASKYGRHFVTIVGYKSTTNGTDASDLLFLDSWDGELGTIGVSRQKGDSSVINHPCQDVGGEFWASANQN